MPEPPFPGPPAYAFEYASHIGRRDAGAPGSREKCGGAYPARRRRRTPGVRRNGGGDRNAPANGRGAVTDRADTTETDNPPPESSLIPALEEAWERTGGGRRLGEVCAIRREPQWTCAQAVAGAGNTVSPPTGHNGGARTERGSKSARPGDIRRMSDRLLAAGGIDRQFADTGRPIRVVDTFKQQQLRAGPCREFPPGPPQLKIALLPRAPRDSEFDPPCLRMRHPRDSVLVHVFRARPLRCSRASGFLRRSRFRVDIREPSRFAKRGFTLRFTGQNEALIGQPLRSDVGGVRAFRMDRRRQSVHRVRHQPFISPGFQKQGSEIDFARSEQAQPFGIDSRDEIAVGVGGAFDHNAHVMAVDGIPTLENLCAIVIDEDTRAPYRPHGGGEQLAMMSKAASGHHV